MKRGAGPDMLRRVRLVGSLGKPRLLVVVLACVTWLAMLGLTLASLVGLHARLASVFTVVALLLLGASLGVCTWLFQHRQPRLPARGSALRDPLTGLRSRDYFAERLGEELLRAQRYGSNFTVLLLDVDGLRILNDAYGRAGGDGVLRSVGGALRSRIRACDLAARLDGSGFAVLLAEAGEVEAMAAAERIISAADDRARLQYGHDRPLSLSYGCASYQIEARTSDMLLQTAGGALTAMKREKRRQMRSRSEQ